MRALRFAAPEGWPDTFKRTGAAMYAGDSFGRAASLAYYFFLALFPGLLFVMSGRQPVPGSAPDRSHRRDC